MCHGFPKLVFKLRQNWRRFIGLALTFGTAFVGVVLGKVFVGGP